MLNTDYQSRHPYPCLTNLCQYCKFAEDLQKVGDNCDFIRSLEADSINAVTLSDIAKDSSLMPFIQKKTWADAQMNCGVHGKVRELIRVGQRPDKHRTKGINTTIKLLYNYYTENRLQVDEDNMVMIRVKDGHFPNSTAISIPPNLAPGLIQALHFKLSHPSRGQLWGLVKRYFHSVGLKNIVDEISEHCHQCLALRPLPASFTAQTTTVPTILGARFSADILERFSQRIIAVRESLSSYTYLEIINDQTANSLREALLKAVLPIIPNTGAVVRVDGATAWQSLAKEAEEGIGALGRFKIGIEVGNLLNLNKHPEAENCVKEVEKEILRFDPDAKALSPSELAIVAKQINTRVRFKGWAAEEILLKRDQIQRQALNFADSDLSEKIGLNREAHHERVKPTSITQPLEQGDLVYLKKGGDKNNAREVHIVVNNPTSPEEKVTIKKIGKQLRKRNYHTDPATLVKLPTHKVSKPNVDNPADTSPNPPPNPRGTVRRAAAKKASRAWADLHCLICESSDRVGWCPEHYEEDSLVTTWSSAPPNQPPPINVQTIGGSTRVLPPKPPRQQAQRSKSPQILSSSTNPNFKSPPQKRTSSRIKSLDRPDYLAMSLGKTPSKK